jgi:hypothetical protein
MKVRVGIIFSNEKKILLLVKRKGTQINSLHIQELSEGREHKLTNIEDWWYVQYSRR